jgi:uncharacterized membrane protein YhaH (DUF805 family)
LAEHTRLIWLFFRFKGRVARAAYFLAGLFLAIVQAFLLYRFTLTPEGTQASETWAALFWLSFLVSVWSNVALGVKRLHDIDRPGLYAVALFIPVLSIIAFVGLCLMPGTPGPNRYGDQPNVPLL